MYDMRIELHVFKEIKLHSVAVTAQIITGKIHEHHVFGLLLSVVPQILSRLDVLRLTTGTSRRSGNRVYICPAALYTAMCLRR